MLVLRPEARRVAVRTPGRTETRSGDRARLRSRGGTGVYVAEVGDDSIPFAVNSSTQTRRHRARAAVTVGNQTADAGVRRPPQVAVKWAVVAALLVVLAEWWVYAVVCDKPPNISPVGVPLLPGVAPGEDAVSRREAIMFVALHRLFVVIAIIAI